MMIEHLHLPSEILARGLLHARRIAPLAINEQLLDAYITSIRIKNFSLNRNTSEWSQLQKCLKDPGIFIKDEIKQELNATPIYVLPFPICIAYSELLDNKHPIIVISAGLINLLASSIFLAQLQSFLPSELSSYYFLDLRRDMDAHQLLTNALFLLQLHHYRYGTPLPNISAMLTKELLVHSKIAINGMITFILLHELGHHKLGHLRSIPERNTTTPPLIIPEKLDDYMHQEIEADRFALDSIKDEAKVIGTFWQQQSMTFFTSLELVSGMQLDRAHPMSINRSYYSDQLRRLWGRDHGVEPRDKFYHLLAARFRSTSVHKKEEINAFVNTTHEGCWHVIDKLNETYGALRIDLEQLKITPNLSWLSLNESLPEDF